MADRRASLLTSVDVPNRSDRCVRWCIVVEEHHNNSSIRMIDRDCDRRNSLSMTRTRMRRRRTRRTGESPADLRLVLIARWANGRRKKV